MNTELLVARADRRMTRRYLPRPGVTINFRAGTLGLGPDLAVSVIDLSEDGLCLRSKAAVSPGAEAEVSVARAGWGRPLKLLCEVRWCEEDEQGKFLVGVRYRKRMLHRDLSELVRMS